MDWRNKSLGFKVSGDAKDDRVQFGIRSRFYQVIGRSQRQAECFFLWDPRSAPNDLDDPVISPDGRELPEYLRTGKIMHFVIYEQDGGQSVRRATGKELEKGDSRTRVIHPGSRPLPEFVAEHHAVVLVVICD